MIQVIVSDSCPHCDTQKEIMRDAFYSDEYKFIHVGSQEFERLDVKDIIDAVPYIVIRDDEGSVKYATRGNLEAIKIRRILNAEDNTFNLSVLRQQKAS